MISRTMLFAVATGFAIPAFAQAPPETAGCNAASHACNVIITVDNCVPRPRPDPVPILAAISPAVINWRIDARSVQAGFTFTPANGIVPHDDQDQQFSGHTSASPTHFHVTDRNTNHSTYKYAINVQKNGTACPTLDPSIVNGAK